MSTRPLCPACHGDTLGGSAALLPMCVDPPGLLRWGGHVGAGTCTQVCNARTSGFGHNSSCLFPHPLGPWPRSPEGARLLLLLWPQTCPGWAPGRGGFGPHTCPSAQAPLRLCTLSGTAHLPSPAPFPLPARTSSLTPQPLGVITLRSHSSRKPCLPPQHSDRVCLSQGPCGISWVILRGFPSVPVNTP